jgi:hypothetical protein
MTSEKYLVTLKFQDDNMPSVHCPCDTIGQSVDAACGFLRTYAGASAVWIDHDKKRMIYDPTGNYIGTVVL